MDDVNENDMIRLDPNSIGPDDGQILSEVIAAKLRSERLLLSQRVKAQHEALRDDVEAEDRGEGKRGEIKKDGVLNASVLSETHEDSLREKKLLKKLKVMDFVSNYKDSFFREVEELNLNVDALLENWKDIKNHEGISRKLRKKLGIIMARGNAKRKKKEKMQNLIAEMIGDSDSD